MVGNGGDMTWRHVVGNIVVYIVVDFVVTGDFKMAMFAAQVTDKPCASCSQCSIAVKYYSIVVPWLHYWWQILATVLVTWCFYRFIATFPYSCLNVIVQCC